MKKIDSIIFILISVVIIYIGYTYNENRKKKETYKIALVKDLEQAYKRIKVEELDRTIKMNKNIQNYFDIARQESNLKKSFYNDVKDYIITEKHHNINLDLETLDDINWKAAQQSGVLVQFNKAELVLLNKVYNINEILRITKESVKNLTLESFPSSTKGEINTISYKYLVILLKLEATLYHLENAIKNTLEKLDPDNKLLKKLNSK